MHRTPFHGNPIHRSDVSDVVSRKHAKLEQEAQVLHVNALTATLSPTGYFRGHSSSYWQNKANEVLALQDELLRTTLTSRHGHGMVVASKEIP